MSRSPDDSAHTDDSKVKSEEEIRLTPSEIKFITTINKQYETMKQRTEFITKIIGTTRQIGELMRPIAKTLLSWGKFLKHKIEDSYMIAINQNVSDNIKEKEGIEKALARLEVIIYNDAFEHFTSDKKTLSYRTIKDYINANGGKIKNMIQFAYIMCYKLQGRGTLEGFEESLENLAIMYIVHSQCQPEVDYTATSYTQKEIEGAIDACFYKEPGTYLPKGKRAAPNSRRISIKAPGYKLKQNPVTGRLTRVYDDGREVSPTSEDKRIFYPTKPHTKRAFAEGQVPVQGPTKRAKRSTRKAQSV